MKNTQIPKLLKDLTQRDIKILELCSKTFMIIKGSAAELSHDLIPYGYTCNVEGTANLFRVYLPELQFAFVRHDKVAYRSSHSADVCARISVYWQATDQEWVCLSNLYIYSPTKMFADGLLAGHYSLKSHGKFKAVKYFFSDMVGDWIQKLAVQKQYWDESITATIDNETLEVWEEMERGPLGFAAWQPSQTEMETPAEDPPKKKNAKKKTAKKKVMKRVAKKK